MIFVYLHTPAGNAHVFLSLAHELMRQGHQVTIYTYYFDPDACFPDLLKGLTVNFIQRVTTSKKNTSVTTLGSRIGAAMDYYVRVSKIAGQMQPHIYDLIFAAESCSYIPALRYQKYHPCPIVWSVFDPITLVDSNKPESLVGKHKWFSTLLHLHTLVDRKNIQKLHTVIVPTSAMKKSMDRLYGIRAVVLPTAGIHKAHYDQDLRVLAKKRLLRQHIPVDKTKKIIFTNAHFQPHRRYEDILEALMLLDKKQLNSIQFLVSGARSYDAAYYEYIKKRISELHLDKTVFIDSDYKTSEELIGYYQLSDIFVFVPVAQTWGLAPFEAMMCKKPVILSQDVGSAEVFVDAKEVVLVPPKDPSRLAQAISLLLGNPMLSEKVALGGYQKARQFDYERIASDLVRLFQSCVGQ